MDWLRISHERDGSRCLYTISKAGKVFSIYSVVGMLSVHFYSK